MDERTVALLQELANLRDTPGTPFETYLILNHAVSAISSLSNDLKRARERAERYAEELDAQENQVTAVSFYVRDKSSGRCHMVGADRHDSIWVDNTGTLHYHNMQNGDGCSANSHTDPGQGYEFIPSDCGDIEPPIAAKYGIKET